MSIESRIQNFAPSSEKPFFLTCPIPFPSTPMPSNGYQQMREEIVSVWTKAEQDFQKMFQNPSYGTPIREFWENMGETADVSLQELGNLVGIRDSRCAKKIRSSLGVGQLVKQTDEGLWRFTKLETAQLMVGFIAKSEREIYLGQLANENNHNQGFLDSRLDKLF